MSYYLIKSALKGTYGEREYHRIWKSNAKMQKLRLWDTNFKIGPGQAKKFLINL